MEEEKIGIKVFDNPDDLSNQKIVRNITSRFQTIQNNLKPKKDDVNFVVKGLQSICLLKKVTGNKAVLQCALEGLDAIQILCYNSVKIDESSLVAKTISFAAENNFTDEAINLSSYYFTLMIEMESQKAMKSENSAKNRIKYKDYCKSQKVFQKVSEIEEVAMKQNKSSKEKLIFVLLSRIKLLQKKGESIESADCLNLVKQILEQSQDIDEKSKSFWREWSLLKHRGYLQLSCKIQHGVDSHQLAEFYYEIFKEQKVNSEQLGAILIEQMNQSKQETVFERNSIHSGIVSSIEKICSNGSMNQLKEWFQSQNLNAAIEVLAFNLDDPILTIRVGVAIERIQLNQMKLASLLLKGFVLLKTQQVEFKFQMEEQINKKASSHSTVLFQNQTKGEDTNKSCPKIHLKDIIQQLKITKQESKKCSSNSNKDANIEKALAIRIFNEIQKLKGNVLLIDTKEILKLLENNESNSKRLGFNEIKSQLMQFLELQNEVLDYLDSSTLDTQELIARNYFSMSIYSILCSFQQQQEQRFETTSYSSQNTDLNSSEFIETQFDSKQSNLSITCLVKNCLFHAGLCKSRDLKLYFQDSLLRMSISIFKNNSNLLQLSSDLVNVLLQTNLIATKSPNAKLLSILLMWADSLECSYGSKIPVAKQQQNKSCLTCQFRISIIGESVMQQMHQQIQQESEDSLQCLALLGMAYFSERIRCGMDTSLATNQFKILKEKILMENNQNQLKFFDIQMEVLCRLILSQKKTQSNQEENQSEGSEKSLNKLSKGFEEVCENVVMMLQWNSKNLEQQMKILLTYLEFSEFCIATLQNIQEQEQKQSILQPFKTAKKMKSNSDESDDLIESNSQQNSSNSFHASDESQKNGSEKYEQSNDKMNQSNLQPSNCINKHIIMIRRLTVDNFEQFHSAGSVNLSNQRAFNHVLIQILTRLSKLFQQKCLFPLKDSSSSSFSSSTSSQQKSNQDNQIEKLCGRLNLHISMAVKLIQLIFENRVSETAGIENIIDSNVVYEGGAYYSQTQTILFELSSHFSMFFNEIGIQINFSCNFITNILLASSLQDSTIHNLFKHLSAGLCKRGLRQLIQCINLIKEDALFFGQYELQSKASFVQIILLQYLSHLLQQNNWKKQSFNEEIDYMDVKEISFNQHLLQIHLYLVIESIVGMFCNMGLIEEAMKLQEYSHTHTPVEETNEFYKQAKKRGISTSKGNRKSSHHQLKLLKCVLSELQLTKVENSCQETSSKQCIFHFRDLLKLIDKIEGKVLKTQLRNKDGWSIKELQYLMMSQRVHLLCGQKAREMNGSELAITLVDKAFKKLTGLAFNKASGVFTDIFSKSVQSNILAENIQENVATQANTAVKIQNKTAKREQKRREESQRKEMNAENTNDSENIGGKILNLSQDCVEVVVGRLVEFWRYGMKGKMVQHLLVKTLSQLCAIHKSQNSLTDLKYYSKLLSISSARFLQFNNFLKSSVLMAHTEMEDQQVLVDIISNTIEATVIKFTSVEQPNNQNSSSYLRNLFDRRKSNVHHQLSISKFISQLKVKLPSLFSPPLLYTSFFSQAVSFLISLFASQIKNALDKQLETTICSLILFKSPLFKLMQSSSESQRIYNCSQFPLYLNLSSYINSFSSSSIYSKSTKQILIAHEFIQQHSLSHSNQKSFYLRYPVLVQSLNLLQAVTAILSEVDRKKQLIELPQIPYNDTNIISNTNDQQTANKQYVIKIETDEENKISNMVGVCSALINLRELCKLIGLSFLHYDVNYFKELFYLYQKHDESLREIIREFPQVISKFESLTYSFSCDCFSLSSQTPMSILNSVEDSFIVETFSIDFSYTHKLRMSAQQSKQSPSSSSKELDNKKESCSSSKQENDDIQIATMKVRESLRDFSISNYNKTPISKLMSQCIKKCKIDGFMVRKEALRKLQLKNDIIILNFFDFNNERVLTISKKNYLNNRYSTFKISNQTITNLFADYINDIKKMLHTNESNMRQEEKKRRSQIDSQSWWKTRFSFDKQLAKILTQTASIFDYHIVNKYPQKALFFGSEDEKREKKILSLVEEAIEKAKKIAKIQDFTNKNFQQENESLIEILFSVVKCSQFLKLKDKKLKIIFQLLAINNIFLFSLGQQAQSFLQDELLSIKDKTMSEYSPSFKKPMLWMLSDNLQQVPLDFMLTFVDNQQTFYRIPSVDYLIQNYTTNHKVNFSQAYYMLNPSGDLVNTQAKFQRKFEGIRSWEGTSGFSASSEELQKVLQTYELYQYIGHGAGELYLTPKQIMEVGKIKSAVLLFGCQSAKQVFQMDSSSNSYEITGNSLYFLMAACKLVVGSLWDVTDRDTDKIVFKLIKIFQASTIDNPIDFTHAFLQARDECQLKQLNGSSFVAYGIPTLFYSS